MFTAQQSYQPIFVARQAIYNRDGKIFGYKLLFRDSGQADTAQIEDFDQATAQVIADGVALAQQGLTTPAPVCITVPRNLLRKEAVLALPPERTIVQVQDAETPDRSVVNACERLKELGFQVAVAIPSYAALITLADIVFMDLRGREHGDVIKLLQKMADYPGQRLAEKVEDKQTFQMARSAGFQLFQGYFFAKPKIIPGRKIQSAAASKIKLIQEVSRDDFEVATLSKIISTDPALSLRLLNFINSVHYSLSRKVESISQAIAIIGQRPLRQWLMAVLLADLNENPELEDVYYISVQRARFFEMLAESTKARPLNKDAMVLVGLFSKIDALMGIPLEEILDATPLDDSIKDSLLGKHDASQWITMAEAVEDGRWDEMQETLKRFDLSQVDAAIAYNKASVWASELLGTASVHEAA